MTVSKKRNRKKEIESRERWIKTDGRRDVLERIQTGIDIKVTGH